MGAGKKHFIVVLCTTPPGKGEEIAKGLVESKTAACVNVVKGLKSFYWWKGKVEEDSEEILIIKTLKEKFDELKSKIKEMHPYTIPEIIALNIDEGSEDYLEWMLGLF